MRKESDLRGYQSRAVDLMVYNEKLGLFLECGLGKTVITYTAIVRLKALGLINKVLVVAPKTVAENVWPHEIDEWEHLQGLRVSVIAGTPAQRKEAMERDADVYIVGRDNVAKLSMERSFYWRCDMLVLDESTSFKNPSSQRWKAFARKLKRPRKWIDEFRRVYLLTGTPVSESMAALWPQIWLLDKGERLFPTITQFRRTYMQPEMIRNCIIYRRFLPGAEDVIKQKVKDICVSMRKEDWLELPPLVSVIRWTGYTPDGLYKTMKTDGVVSVEDHHIMAVDGATRFNKMRQLASGYIYTELGQSLFIHDKKEETLKELLESIGNKPVLVFYQFDFEREFLILDMGCETLETPDQQERWNAGEIKRACAHPASLGYGNNLQAGGNIIVWYSLPLSLEQYVQANNRLHRSGQKERVILYHLLGKGTVEERIYKLLTAKKAVLLKDIMLYLKEEM